MDFGGGGFSGEMTATGIAAVIGGLVEQVKNLNHSMQEIKEAMNDLGDRFEADAAQHRGTSGDLAVVKSLIDGLKSVSAEHERRIGVVESWRTYVIGWCAGASAVGGIIGAAAMKLLFH